MQHVDRGNVSEAEAARRTLGGGSIWTYGGVAVEFTARDGKVTAAVVDGTTLQSTEHEGVSRRGGLWAAAPSALTDCRPDNVQHKHRGNVSEGESARRAL